MAEPATTQTTPREDEATARPKLVPGRRGETSRRRLIADRAAKWVVTAGGLAIIAAILGILLFILVEVWPLTATPEVATLRQVSVPGAPLGAIVADEHRTAVAGLTSDGRLLVVRSRDGKILHDAPVLAPAPPVPGAPGPAPAAPGAPATAALDHLQVQPQSNLLSATTRDGRVLLVPVEFEVTFEGDRRAVAPRIGEPVALTLDPRGLPVRDFAAQTDGEGNATAAAEIAGGRLAVVRRATEQNLMTGEATESLSRAEIALPGPLTALVMDSAQANLYGGTASGELLWWALSEGEPGEARVASAGNSAITALSLLLGGRSLVVGQEDGALSVWFPVRQRDDTFRLTRIRDFPPHPGPIAAIGPSARDKGFAALDRGGELGLYFSTSHRTLWRGRAPIEGAGSLFLAPKADALFLAGQGRLAELDIFNPHPEITPRAMFGKTWFEGYEKPEYVWQSTGGTDDFEPKLSLTPLLVGTLKGTFYSLLLAIPLGIFGAMYTSQFMHETYTRYLKPLIEIMASLPSVVLGFLAGLWLAPRLEDAIPALAMMVVVLPLLVLIAGWSWQSLPRAFRGRFRTGFEALPFILVLAGGIWLCLELSPAVERVVFGGDFHAWLLETTGLPFDQRNAIVVGLAMGFAVIPIIFAIAEDAFSNVPRNLVAGSLALGANRWQTVTKVVLPTASPGIFSAVMIGFGRAVGETMIVLMATGNTPILDWNPFNGFRTLSANIAVEIPEAPHGSTLYRMLFVAALLLFIMTFVVNTAAELVRQRLRRRFSQL